MTLTLKIVTNFFLPDTPPRKNTLAYQIWLKMVEQFRRYRRDKIGHTDRMTGKEQTEMAPPYEVKIEAKSTFVA